MRTDIFSWRISAALAAATLVACGGDRPADSATARDTTAALGSQTPVGSGAPLAYVSNEDSQTLSVIDTGTDSVIATIPVGTRPRGVRVTDDGSTVYVALSGSPKCPPTMPDEECEKMEADKSKDGIAEVDIRTGKVTRVLPGGSDPETFDIGVDESRIFVSNEDVHTASLVSLESGEVIATVPVGKEPEGVRLHPDGKTVWVTGETDHDVTVLDTETGKTIRKISVGKRPRDLAFSPDGSKAYVTAEVDGTISVVDVASGKVTDTIRLPEGSLPMGIVFSPDGSKLYVANGRGKTVSLIDPQTNTVVRSVEVGTRPWGIAITPDGRKLYTANGPSDDVTVVDAASLEVLKRIPVGETPWGVAIGPAPGGAETASR